MADQPSLAMRRTEARTEFLRVKSSPSCSCIYSIAGCLAIA